MSGFEGSNEGKRNEGEMLFQSSRSLHHREEHLLYLNKEREKTP